MRTLLVALILGALAGASVPAASAAPSSKSSWAGDANKVCAVWLAKAKQEFGSPVTPAQLFTFAKKAKALETSELAALQKIPGRSASGTHALQAVQTDIAEVGSAITAYKAGNAAKFVTVLKRYINDNRPKAAFTAAGASGCG